MSHDIKAPGATCELEIVIIDDEPDFLSTTAELLSMLGYKVRTADNFTEAENVVKSLTGEAVIFVDRFFKGSRKTGPEFFVELRKLTDHPVVGVLISGYDSEETQIDGWQKGMRLYIRKPASTSILVEAIKSGGDLLKMERLAREGKHDPLTKLLTRSAFFQISVPAIQKLINKKGVAYISCIFLDIDDFKQVNDTLGNHIGDRVLEAIGTFLQGHEDIRANDLVCRFGGDEILILLLETGGKAAVKIASRLKKDISVLDIRDDAGQRIVVSISAGVHTLSNKEMDNATETIEWLHRVSNLRMHAEKTASKSGRANNSIR